MFLWRKMARMCNESKKYSHERDEKRVRVYWSKSDGFYKQEKISYIIQSIHKKTYDIYIQVKS